MGTGYRIKPGTSFAGMTLFTLILYVRLNPAFCPSGFVSVDLGSALNFKVLMLVMES
jgi:hypothetical protein